MAQSMCVCVVPSFTLYYIWWRSLWMEARRGQRNGGTECEPGDLSFFCMWGWHNHQSPLTDPLQAESVTLWKVSYCVLGRDKVCPHSGSRCHGDNGRKQRLAETGLLVSNPFPQEHWVSEALFCMFSCRVAKRKKENIRSQWAFHFLPVLPPYPKIQKFRKLVC